MEELRVITTSPNAEMVCFMLIQQTDDLKVPTSIASMIQARIDHMQVRLSPSQEGGGRQGTPNSPDKT